MNRLGRLARRDRWVGIALAVFISFDAHILLPAGTEELGQIEAAEMPLGPKLLRSPQANAGHYIVVLREERDAEGKVQVMRAEDVQAWGDTLTAAYGGQVEWVYTRALRGFSAAMTEAEAEALSLDSAVAFVEEDSLVSLALTQNDPPSWGLDRIDQRYLPLDDAYRYGRRGSGVNVYVIDTGIRYSHNEFQGRAVPLFGPSGNAWDCNGHGTHVAGTVGGATAGVAKGVTLYGVRVFDSACIGSTAGVVAGVDYVTYYDFNFHYGQPSVANMSLQGPPSDAMDLAVTNSIAFGITYVVAAGNYNIDAVFSSPARVAAAITVAASDIGDYKASFSNYGSLIDLFAPGVNIASAWISADNHYAYLSGTSMASPHVAGAAALYQAGHPTASPSAVRNWLVATATSVVSGAPFGTTNDLLHLPPPPPAPTAVEAEHTCGREIRVSWSQAGAPETIAIERQRTDAPGWSEIARVGGSVRQYLDRNVTLGKTYSYRLRATAAAGDSDYSASANATVVPVSVGGVTLDSDSVVQSQTQRVTWSSAEQEEYTLFLFDALGSNPIDTSAYIPGGGADGRIAEAAPSGAKTHIWTVPRNLPLQDYTIRVEARDSCGGSARALSPPFEVLSRNQVTFQTGAASVSENAGTAELWIVFSTADGTVSTNNASVRFDSASITASPSSDNCVTGDYRHAAGVVSFPAGTSSGLTKAIEVTICSDRLDEADETLKLSLSEPNGTTLLDPRVVTLSIADDDLPPRLRIGDVLVTEPVLEPVKIAVAVSLSAPSGRSIEVDYTTVNGTALAGVDYLARAGTLRFPPGVTTQAVTITVIPDLLVEPDEVFSVKLHSPVNASLEDDEAIVVVMDPPYVAVGDASSLEGDDGESPLIFRVTLTKSSAEPVLVPWFTTATGTTDPGLDYVEATGVLELAPGTLEGTISIAILGETLYEYDQSFALHLEQPANAGLLDAEARGWILNDDLPPAVVVEGVTTDEGVLQTWPLSLEAKKLGPTERPFLVTWRTQDETATAGSDYVSRSGVIKWDTRFGIPEAPEPTVAVLVHGDRVVESDETFTIGVYGNTEQPGVLLSESRVVLLNDDQPPPPPPVLLSVSNASVREGDTGTTQLTFQVSLLGPAAGPVTVQWSTIAGGTATEGVDYLAASGSLTFPLGTTATTFSVTVFGDQARREKDESVLVQIFGASGATIQDGLGTGVIRDDDSVGIGPLS